MENKQVRQSYGGMVKDLTKSKFPNKIYYDAKNINITATNSQSTYSVTNEKGNKLVLAIPNVTINRNKTITYLDKVLSYINDEIIDNYLQGGILSITSGKQFIIGQATVRDNIILFTTDNDGFDCIWKVNDTTFDIDLLYIRNLGFSINDPIQVINNYENKIIDKIYWVNGKSQMNFLNIYSSIDNRDSNNVIDIPQGVISLNGIYKTSQPEIISKGAGGIHTSGMIQYAYNLYNLNGSQTILSSLSVLCSLDKGYELGGGEVNEVVGTVPLIEISDIDEKYDNIKIYAIKYTSYNQLPQVSLIFDRKIPSSKKVSYNDDGRIIQDISLEEFIFLGSNIIIPKHINTKNNIMFLANYKERNFDIPTEDEINSIDLRAYSFQSNKTTTEVYNSLKSSGGIISSDEPKLTIQSSTITTGIPKVNHDHSAINKNYNSFNKQYNSTILGGEGPYLKYSIKRNFTTISLGVVDRKEVSNVLKDNEIYRIGIEFYNKYGQYSLPKWIADFKTIVQGDQSNINGYYSSIDITLKPLFYTWLNDNNNFLDENGDYDDFLKPVGYRILRADRTISDRTILCQGILNGMVSQLSPDGTGGADSDLDINKVNKGLKLPSMMRRFDDSLYPMRGNGNYKRLDIYGGNRLGGREVFKSSSSDGWSTGTYQFNSLMNMFSPEITFNSIQSLAQTKLKTIGTMTSSAEGAYSEVRDITTKLTNTSLIIKNAISPYDPLAILESRTGIEGELFFNRFGYFGPSNGELMQFNQTYREYKGLLKKSTNNILYDVYGSPEIVETGQGRKSYNNDNDLVYYNSLENLSTDSGVFDDNSPNHGISSINSWGARNITFALGENNILTKDRLTIEKLYLLSGVLNPKSALIGEFVIEEDLVYVGNIYGGNSYESKKRTNYLKTGEYKDISINYYNNTNIGDTFVGEFKFTKLVKTETEIYKEESQQITEIVNVILETTVDVKNRNDLSITKWNNRFQPRYEEYQKYNKVYSQQPSLQLSKDVDYKFKKIKSFDTNVIATKAKVPGEVVDSWTDLQPNNTITLDGKYGPINILHSFNDNIYAIQDKALSYLSINPRVQVQGSDGMSVELGTGTVLDDYKYISTDSGTLNKWSVVNSPSSFYYYDALNKSLNSFKGQVDGISDSKGIHAWLTSNTLLEELKINNPLIKKGISSGYDFINNNMFMTFHQENPFTISYNEAMQQFISFHDYIPSMYISKGDNFITTHPDINKIYQQGDGYYNNFYGQSFKSTITLMINPESDMDTVFDNIMFKSEVYINDIDQPASTLTALRLYNEHQDSGIIPLVFGRDKNLRRKFRDWNAILPRNQGTRERIRNPWVYLTLEFDNTTNKKLILHDIVVSYSV